VIGADLHRLDRRVDGRVGGQQDDEDLRILLLDLAQDRHAVDVWELVVEQHQIDAVANAIEGLPPGGRLDHLVAVGAQALGQGPADQRFVVDDEDGGGRHQGSRSPANRPF
jgi:hypothetical protein